MTPTREQYEAAARAAGYAIRWHDDAAWIDSTPDGNGIVIGRQWCPTEDDSDAFRLMVSIPLDVMRTKKDVEALASLPPHVKIDAHTVVAPFGIEPLGDDPVAATRMAIFRAAVKVGRALREREGGDG